MHHRLLRYSSALMIALALGICSLAPLGNARAQTSGTPQAAVPGSTIFALATNTGLGAQAQRLISFDFSAPATLRSDMQITGLQAGEILKGIDFRPATGQLFGLGSSSRLYIINPDTAVATQVGSAFTTTLNSTFFYGFNFNPVPDRIRVIGNVNQQNLRLNPNTGAIAATDTNVAYASGDTNFGDPPNIVAVAYNNNVAGATSTTNYGIDVRSGGNTPAGTARLVTVGSVNGSPNSPNTGLLSTVATITDASGASLLTNNLVGFDIAQDGTAYLSVTPPNPFNAPSTLYTLNLSSGRATPVGVIGSGLRVSALTVAVPNRSISTFQFSQAAYTVAENGGTIVLTVNRTGDTAGAATVDFQTDDPTAYTLCNVRNSGTANARCDYSSLAGTLTFAPGDTTRTITISIVNDGFNEGNETFTVSLRNPSSGTSAGSPTTATVTITDDDAADTAANPIDSTEFFVTQQYRDFLNREPEAGGFAYWTGQINQCGTDQTCITRKRIDVSAAFFIEQEFQQTGSFIIRLYRAAFGRRPTYLEFVRDFGRLSNSPTAAETAARQAAFANEFSARTEFNTRYGSLSNADFVNRLYQTANVPFIDSQARDELINDLNSGQTTRAQVLRNLINVPFFSTREFNPTFVLAEYLGYLRRDPDEAGYQFWLDVLNNRVPGNYRAMVCAFLTSAEYQQRFGSNVTRTNADCR
ncbi:MAG: DUF4394 domain-containing protein [Pyrinomonadaceae bacterium]